MRDKKKKTNAKLKNNNTKGKLENNVNNNGNQDTSKNKVEDEKEQCKYKKRCLKYIFFLTYNCFDNN